MAARNRFVKMSSAFLLGVIFGLFASPVEWLLAHEGESHSSLAVSTEKNQKSFSVAGSGETFELTVAYRKFEPGEIVPLQLFLADIESNRPVPDSELSLTLIGPNTEAPIRSTPTDQPGVYQAEASIPSSQDYSLLVEVSSQAGVEDLFSIDGFAAPATDNASPTSHQPSPFWHKVEDHFGYFVAGALVVVALAAYSFGAHERVRRLHETRELGKESG